MTLVLSCITHDHVVQVSDRRLTSLSDGSLRDDDANKVTMYNQVIFSYSGLASIEGMSTDKWLVKLLSAKQYETLWHAAHGIANEATIAFRKVQLPQSKKRHAFVAVGFVRLVPVIEGEAPAAITLVISNALDETGAWLPTAEGSFTIRHRLLQRSHTFDISYIGYAVPRQDRVKVERLVRLCVEKNTGPRPIARVLASAVRTAASQTGSVGRNLLAVSIPLAALSGPASDYYFYGDLIGAMIPLMQMPRDEAHFLYLPEGGYAGVQYGPNLVTVGASITDTRMLSGEKATEEAKNLPTQIIIRAKVLSDWVGSGRTTDDARRPQLVDDYKVDRWTDLTSVEGWPADQACPYYGLLIGIDADDATMDLLRQDTRYFVVIDSAVPSSQYHSSDWFQSLRIWLISRGTSVHEADDLVERRSGKARETMALELSSFLRLPRPNQPPSS